MVVVMIGRAAKELGRLTSQSRVLLFFFSSRRRHTRLQGDWSSDVCSSDLGKSRSQGWELELSGEPAPGWQVLAGYTYTQARYLRDASEANVGQPLRPVEPRHALRLFASHRFKIGRAACRERG